MLFSVLIYSFKISIHAPREGGDKAKAVNFGFVYDFNPRPPRGGRPREPTRGLSSMNFNPRPPRGGRRPRIVKVESGLKNFNPRPPRGGRLRNISGIFTANGISIHAPREGGDSKDAQFYLWIFDK